MESDDIRRLRGELGMDQVTFAARLGITHFHVSRMETGKKPVGAEVEAKIALMLSAARDGAVQAGVASIMKEVEGRDTPIATKIRGECEGILALFDKEGSGT